MVLKAIKPVDGAAKCAAISKYSSDRQSGERGQRQQFLDCCNPKPEKSEPEGLEKFFTKASRKPAGELSEFELMLRKVWEDNLRMQESARVLESTSAMTINPFEASYIMGINSAYRPVIKK